MHRSASDYGVQNRRRLVWVRLPFNHLNPCFCLLHVVQIKTFSFSVHLSVYRNRKHNRGLSLSNDVSYFQRHVSLFTGTPPQKESRAEFFKLWFQKQLTSFENGLPLYRGSLNRWINRKWQRLSLSNMQRKKGSKRIEMIIKMVIEFKLTVVHFARPNPTQICACAWIYRWTKQLWKIRTGTPGLRAAG